VTIGTGILTLHSRKF